MTDFLIRLFIKNSGAVLDPNVRERYGRLSGCVGIVLNFLLFAGKFAAGYLTASIAITADAFNNLSDAGSSVITLIGFRLAKQRADSSHPFGHGRMEYMAGLVVSLLILLVGFELGKSSFEKILHPAEVSFSALSVVILAASVCIKLWMFLFNRTLGRRIGSPAMAATAADSLSDVCATSAVLLSSLAGHFWGLRIDAWMGMLVAIFILRAGWSAAKDTLDPLLGKSPDPELVNAIEETVMAHHEICGMHDLVIHDYGPGRAMMSFHVEVPVGGDIMALHDIIDATERELKEKFHIETSIHMDPIVTDDELTNRTRDRVIRLVQDIDEGLSIHDFRMTAGPMHTNLIFDVVVPYGCVLSDQQVEQAVKKGVEKLEGGTYFAVLQVDHSYIAPA